jgi:hypothetical protein
MSDNNGWPGKPGVPLNPERDGWHWLRYEHDGYVEISAFLWERDGYWVKSRHVHYSEWVGRWTYAGPVLTPAEVEARVKEAQRDALEEAAQALIEKYQSTIIRPNTPEAWRFAILQDLQEMAGKKPKIITAGDIDALAKGEGDE